LYAYLHCLRDPKKLDALRSERYCIQRLALESRLFGDDTSGMFTVEMDDLGNISSPAQEARKLESPSSADSASGANE